MAFPGNTQASAASRCLAAHSIRFITAIWPSLAPLADRYALVALACAGQPRFIASLAESDEDHARREAFYSVDTVRCFRRQLRAAATRLFFLMGADSFLHIRTWKEYQTLLGLCDFIVASRPGFRMDALRQVIPPKLLAARAAARPARGGSSSG